MPCCYAKYCTSRRGQKSTKQLQWETSHGIISFHRLPNIPEVRKKWLDRMGLDASDVPNTASFCSLHFEEKDLDRTSLACARLRPGAVPCINISEEVNGSTYLQRHSSPSKEYLPQKLCKISNEDTMNQEETVCHSATQHIFVTRRKETSDALQSDEHAITTYTDVSDAINIEISNTEGSSEEVSKSVHTSPRKRMRSRGTAVSPRISENSPRKKILRNALNNMKKTYQKKIKILQQKQRRSAKSIARLKDVLAALQRKNLLDTQQLDVLKDLESLQSSHNTQQSDCFS